MSTTFASWVSGVAEVVATHARGVVTVKCPHCKRTHRHGRDMLGSKSVAAGCHVGYRRCLEYRIVDLGQGRAKNNRRRG